ncbi:MAG: S9 family peptidase [Myxococcales bacterium]|nr:S9 family peptidase [Myxococcales bacterium]
MRDLTMKRIETITVLALLALLAGALAATAAPRVRVPKPIPARTGKTTYTLHGVSISDPYRWLENEKDPAVKGWIDKQQKRTESVLAQIPARKRIVAELKKLYDYTSDSSYFVRGTRYFFFRKEGLKNQPLLYLRDGSYTAKARLLLDPNTLSKDGTVAIQRVRVSPDGKLLAYAAAAKGSDWSEIRVLVIDGGALRSDRITRVRWPNMVWTPDSRGFYYVAFPPPGSVPKADQTYYRRLFYHRLGTPQSEDRFVFGEGRVKEEWIGQYASSDDRYHLIETSLDWAKNDLYLRPIGSKGPFRAIAQGLDGRFDADVIGDKLVVFTTYKAPRGRVMWTTLDKLAFDHWKTLVAEPQTGVITGFRAVKDAIVVQSVVDVTSRLTIVGLDGRPRGSISLPAKGTVDGLFAAHGSSELFFSFQSWVFPPTVFRYDTATRRLTSLASAKKTVDGARYVTEQVFYPSKDGTKIPMFLIYKRGLKKNGKNPTELYGYGGFNISINPVFIVGAIPWLERGGILAVANLRGGGEYGDKWHRAGRRGTKQNVFDDFIAAGEWLIHERYTSRKRLAIRGGSNGGLLVSAVMTQRPELFGAVICAVPLTDMIRYPISTVARLWMKEYGDPNKPNEFEWLWSYSPYHKLKAGTKYPITMVMTADHDDRVDPFHARKFAARLQASTTPGQHVLLRIESKAGHGAGTPLMKRILATADRYAFLLWALGMRIDK